MTTTLEERATTEKTYSISKYQSLYIDGTIVVPICESCGTELIIRNVHGHVGQFCDTCGKRIVNPTEQPSFENNLYNDDIIGLCYIVENTPNKNSL